MTVERSATRSAGVPSKTIRPPSWPAPGPRSTIQSACAMTAWWCSMTITDLPESTSRSSRPSSCSTSARCSPAGRLVEDVDAALLAHVGGQLETLPLAARQRGERLSEAEVAQPDAGEPLEHLVRGRNARLALAEEPLGLVTDIASTSLMSRPPNLYSRTAASNRLPSHSSQVVATPAIIPRSV